MQYMEWPPCKFSRPLEAIGIVVSRYGLVVVLLLIGVVKFTPGRSSGHPAVG